MDWARSNVARERRLAAGQPRHRIGLRGADVVYAKSWGAMPYFGRWQDESPIREAHRHFIVDEAKMALTDNAVFSHCLPLRRNVKATDARHGFAALHRHRRSREPPARAEGGDGALLRKPASRSVMGDRTSATLVDVPPGLFSEMHMSVETASTNAITSAIHGSDDIVLAFSGGLDTSFCVPWLQEQGGACTRCSPIPAASTATNARGSSGVRSELGVASHRTIDGRVGVVGRIRQAVRVGGRGIPGAVPLLVSDRYLIVDALLQRARELGTDAVAHGCTGMGNDQVRFDLAIKASGRYRIVAPIREIQKQHTQTRAYEQQYLEARGHAVDARQKAYTINENLLGRDHVGGEIDRWEAPGEGRARWCAPRVLWPQQHCASSCVSKQANRGARRRGDARRVRSSRASMPHSLHTGVRSAGCNTGDSHHRPEGTDRVREPRD
jgi:hypothetical protein